MRVIDRLRAILGVLVVPSLCVLLGGENAPALILSLTVHELAHFFALKLCATRVLGLDPNGPGLRIRYTAITLPTAAQIMISAAGAAANLALAALALLPGLYRFAGINIVLAAFNLLPIRGLDGGELLLSGLGMVLEPGTAWRVLRAVSMATASVLWLLSLFVQLRLAPMPEILVVSGALLMRELVS